jgi:hypothetical protein
MRWRIGSVGTVKAISRSFPDLVMAIFSTLIYFVCSPLNTIMFRCEVRVLHPILATEVAGEPNIG